MNWHRIVEPSRPYLSDRNRREARTSALWLRVWPKNACVLDMRGGWWWQVELLAKLYRNREWGILRDWGRERTMREAKAAAIAAGHRIIGNLRDELPREKP